MAADVERELHRAVGMSDLAALLAVGFRFPADGRLSQGLSDGSFLGDWLASWEDACAVPFNGDVSFSDAGYEALRREYSRLYLSPGIDVPVWPYEGCFLHRAAGRTDVPDVFRTRASVDVERQMKAAGMQAVRLRTEPGDRVEVELEFVSYLYAKWGEALREQAAAESSTEAKAVVADGPDAWRSRIAAFASGHALRWLPDFMAQTRERSRLETYRSMAELGLCFLGELAKDVQAV